MRQQQLVTESSQNISLDSLITGNIKKKKNNFKMKRVIKIIINQNLNLRFQIINRLQRVKYLDQTKENNIVT